jgi:uncharacterized protein (DUF2147 family)
MPVRFLPRCLILLGSVAWFLAAPHAIAQRPVPKGVWLMEGDVAVETFDCEARMCARIVWLIYPRDEEGEFHRDLHNPNPQLRARLLCGLTIIWNLRPAGKDRWQGGWFYNPENGKTYGISVRFTSVDTILARIYVGLPLFGEDRALVRVPHDTTEGWC